MNAIAVVLEQPERLALSRLDLSPPPGDEDVVVDIDWSGISTGTERLLWSGRMPHFPGMGYPLVPGYESVGRIVSAGPGSGREEGQRVFVPGARCFGDVRGLFGGAASRLVVPGSRVVPIPDDLAERGILLALAATAYHAVAACSAGCPELVVGHGVLGRLIARLTVAKCSKAPTVWERNPIRATGGEGYQVVDPQDDPRVDYRSICDVSGDSTVLDGLIARLAGGGEVVLAGFYDEPLAFSFPPAFMREARIRVAAEWAEADLIAVKEMVEAGHLSLDGLITHRQDAAQAEAAYQTAFTDPTCLKMVLDWRDVA
ncbi:2-desacetyl-2-hydroxyethyl bacteriochlorophyllide A dehydrogenase [Thioflavicoccus mobilis 8321]|uniref:2-desacetyl-2-hydroxyethyl bacteriochlorophyllide A dehydrogenase n=1 Tax=Thioflavicoccus mobilis 8321 TaxID=765912 RepID=L0H0W2_9GAMM|nr:chlorophyll synthesis pathway protein BchC [Thioflavicoccus mobilis]AGA91697.1 2-desacetyl-2-hydroxyethyl bacteriochlorophyllide A dehydrogenase [Thioflavicoccus mobilis 8321]